MIVISFIARFKSILNAERIAVFTPPSVEDHKDKDFLEQDRPCLVFQAVPGCSCQALEVAARFPE